VQELARGHPIRLQILQFASPENAAKKMQEMLASIQKHATTPDTSLPGKEKRPDVGHQSTGVHVSEKELTVTLKPTERGGAVKHPSAADWKAAVKRHEQLCNRDGKVVGTYVPDTSLKRRNMGATTYRVDKFGRRIGD
jgi:hypothetical protein